MIMNQNRRRMGSMSRKLSLCIAIILLFSQMLVGIGMADNHTKLNSVNTSLVLEAIDGAAKQLASMDNLSDWAALGLAKAGHEVPDSYITSAKAAIQEWSNGGFRKVTDLERFAIALGAIGYNPQDFEGFNLVGGVFNHPNMMKQGINGSIYALILLNSGSYNLPVSNEWNEEDLLDAVLKQQNADGGWSLAAGGKSTVDITAMAITALSGWTHDAVAESSVDKAVQWLSKVQLANGGFNDSGDNSESVSQVIIALSSLGIDAATFNDSKPDAVSHLLSFRETDGGFAHMSGMGTNGMATEQALVALLAYDSHSRDQAFTIYDAVQLQASADIHIEGPNGTIAQGSASGKTALDALIGFAAAKDIVLGVKDTSFGTYVNAIGDWVEGIYDGNGGWSFNIYRDGSWQFPAVGMADYELLQGDVLVVYYTDYSTQMVEQVSVEPTKPIEGKPFSVTVKQSTWNWETNAADVTPAIGVQVEIGNTSVFTDAEGIAQFPEGVSAGAFDLVVTGYSSEIAPTVVRHVEHLVIASKKVAVTYAVEGLNSSIIEGTVQAEFALEGFEQLLTANNVQYLVKELSIGRYIAEIDQLTEGTLSGYDGWSYMVKRDGEWIFPMVGISEFALETGDHVVVYYTNYTTDPIQSIELQPALPKAKEAFSIVVNKAVWDWDNSKLLVSPAVGVDVEVDGLQSVTDDSGKAVFPAGAPTGKHTITITGNRANDAPSVVKETSVMYILDDQQQVAGWAESDVQKVLKYGFMYGVSSKSVVFDAKRSITRAEYVAILLRLIGEQPLTNVRSGYADVPAMIWYEGSIAKAKQLGIIEKTVVNFQPDNPITREELAVMTAKALRLSPDSATIHFSDLEKAKSGSSIPHIAAITENGILFGSDNKFMPLDPVTREMAAAVAVRIHEK